MTAVLQPQQPGRVTLSAMTSATLLNAPLLLLLRMTKRSRHVFRAHLSSVLTSEPSAPPRMCLCALMVVLDTDAQLILMSGRIL